MADADVIATGRADLAAARGAALIVPRPDLATIAITGEDRQTWINGLVTADLAKRQVGDGVYALACAKNGKLQSELWMILEKERISMACRAEDRAELMTMLDRYLVMEDAEIAAEPGADENEAEARWVLVWGPRSGEAIEWAATRSDVRAGMTERRGVPVCVVELTGADRGAAMDGLQSTLGADARRATPQSWDFVRIHLGVPAAFVDFDQSNYPQEAALERDAVSFDKGCYLGQEAVFMLEKRGHVKKRLVQLAVEAPSLEAFELGAAIAADDGAELGKVTSRAAGETDDQGAVALGWVKYKSAAAGTRVRIGDHSATVTPLMALTVDA